MTQTKITQKEKMVSYALLIITVILFSSAFVGIRVALRNYSPGTLALFRFLVTSIVIIPLYFKYSKNSKLKFADYSLVFLTGFFGIGVYHFSLNYGEQTVSAGLSSFIVGLAPIFTTLLAFFFLKENLRPKAWIGVAISFVGVVILALSQGGSLSFDVGALWVLIASFASGTYAIWQKTLLKKANAIEISCLIIWAGTISLFMFLPALPEMILNAPIQSTLAVIYLGIFPGAIALTTWSMALKKLTATKASCFLYAMPIVSTFLGWALIGEKVAMFAFIGGCIALAGALMAQT